MARPQTQALRLCDVLQAVREEAANEQETLATIVHLLSSGQVRLSADAITTLRELLVPRPRPRKTCARGSGRQGHEVVPSCANQHRRVRLAQRSMTFASGAVNPCRSRRYAL
jgi:hypothetical protein